MIRYLHLLLFIITLSVRAQSYDTIRIMTYNLLYYRVNFEQCNNTTNNPNNKDNYIATIFDHVKPDIFIVQEMGVNPGAFDGPLVTFHQNIFLNRGLTHYKRANFTRSNNSNIVNACFYNSSKVELKSQFLLTTGSNNQNITRGIDFYTFYYKHPNLGQPGVDTVFFTCIGLHLKAGSTQADITQRQYALEAVMNHINNNIGQANILIMGDFNMNASTEPGFQALINHPNQNIRFYDPLNSLGTWFNNSTYAFLHTQSTRLNQTNNNCFVGGGLDDRYDMILITDPIRNESKGMKYVPNSYKIPGNDGLRFKNFITSTNPVPNTSVPPAVLTALYENSDHLPVYLDVTVMRSNLSISEFAHKKWKWNVSYSDGQLKFLLDGLYPENIDVSVTDMTGKIVYRSKIGVLESEFKLNLPLAKGMYIVNVSDSGHSTSRKIIVY
ncbi:MAG: T9SS type A sorting domain-containing protein [Thermaurantimonas sp.]|uniref:T9SS type A sorting domain-containing protein n=1 Tax=Thermaurantimonas sp. TaxID=2681568 RepID=UPI00391CA996